MSTSKVIHLPCRNYFEQRLLFFIDCKYWSKREDRSAETEELIDKSIMRAAVELKAYAHSIDMLTQEGYEVIVDEREFAPADLKPQVDEESPEEI